MKLIIYKIFNRIFGENSELKKVAFNTFWLFGDRILKLLIGLVVSVIVTRYLGPENYGILSYILAYTSLFTGIASMGLEKILTKELAINSDDKENILGSGFVLQLTGSLVAMVLAVLFIYLSTSNETTTIYVLIVCISFLFQSFDVTKYWFQSQSLSKIVVISSNITIFIFMGIKILLVFFKLPLIYFFIVTSLETISISLAVYFAYKHMNSETRKWHFNFSYAKQFLKLSWPLIIGTLATTVYMRIDQLMIGNILGNTELGIYSVAVRLAELWYFIPYATQTSMIPYLSRISDEDEYYEKIQKYMDLMALVGYLVAFVMTIISRPLISLLYGSQFIEASTVLVIYVWSGLFMNIAIVRGIYFISSGHTKYSMKVTILGAIMNVILNYLFIPKYGIEGAAYATLISYFVYGYATSFIYKGLRKIGIVQTKSLLVIFRRLRNGRKN